MMNLQTEVGIHILICVRSFVVTTDCVKVNQLCSDSFIGFIYKVLRSCDGSGVDLSIDASIIIYNLAEIRFNIINLITRLVC